MNTIIKIKDFLKNQIYIYIYIYIYIIKQFNIMNMNARKYQKVITLLKVITYSLSKDLSDRLEAGSFHGYKFIM
jgi:hypothetical protein